MADKPDLVLASELRTKLRIARRLIQEVHEDLSWKTVGQQRLPRESTNELAQRLEVTIIPLAGVADDVGRLALKPRRKKR